MKHFRTSACLCCALLLSALLGGCVGVNFNSARYGGDRERITGSGARTQLEYDVDPYDEINVRANVELIYSAEPSQTVKVDIFENMAEFLTLYVENGALVIDSEGEFAMGRNSADAVRVYVSNPDLTGVNVRGAVVMTEADPIRADRFSLSVGGACEVDLELYVDELDLSLSGAGEVELSGEARRARMSISGVGQVEAEELATEDLEVSISGTGEASVHCTETLDVSIAGMGTLRYRGNPRVTQKISGMGTVTSMDSSIF